MPDPTPKAVEQLRGHRTKTELEFRRTEEARLSTGKPMTEDARVKADPPAHKMWMKLKPLFRSIGKNDALIGLVINRYCLMCSECLRYEEDGERIRRRMEELEDRRGDMEFTEYLSASQDLEKTYQKCDALLQQKRKMLFDIERENLMTIQGQIRGIQKKPPEDGGAEGLAGWMRQRTG